MVLAYPIPAESELPVEGIQVLIPPVYEIFWSALILFLLWLVLGWALPKIYAMVDERREKIDSGLDAADDAKEAAALAKRKQEEELQKAQEEAARITEAARQTAKRTEDQAKQEAQEEAARITEAANRHIAAERQAAEISLRRDVGALATELAERIVGEQLTDTALSQRVIDRFMDEVEAELDAQSVGANV